MLSLSDNEFSVISFLVRNFTEKLTIRSIAQRLNFSPAGVFNILKKLEKQNIVVGQKLGTGLFYSINFESKIAEHLSAVVLLYSEEKIEIDVEKLRQAKAAILDMSVNRKAISDHDKKSSIFYEKTLLLVVDNVTILDVSIHNVEIITKTEDEVIALLRKKDSQMLKMLQNGVVLFGEDKVLELIKKCISWI